MTSTSLIVTAGGSSVRFGAPKLFVEVKDQPLLIHTLKCFVPFTQLECCIITMTKPMLDIANQLVSKHDWPWPISIIEGGSTRKDSVQKGVEACTSQRVLIHDAARPNVSEAVINTVMCSKDDAVIPGVPITDTIKVCRNNAVEKTIDRSQLMSIQTPQLFSKALLLMCYQQPNLNEVTDEAMLVEHAGKVVSVVEGDPKNLKITHPEDVLYFRYLLTDPS